MSSNWQGNEPWALVEYWALSPNPCNQSFIKLFAIHRYGLIAVVASLANTGYLPARPAACTPNGGTWLGLYPGTIAALLVILPWPSLASQALVQLGPIGTAIGWLSATCTWVSRHFCRYAATAACTSAPNVHTVAYVLHGARPPSVAVGVSMAYVSFPGAMNPTARQSSPQANSCARLRKLEQQRAWSSRRASRRGSRSCERSRPALPTSAGETSGSIAGPDESTLLLVSCGGPAAPQLVSTPTNAR